MQKEGGAIGLRLTGMVAEINMVEKMTTRVFKLFSIM